MRRLLVVLVLGSLLFVRLPLAGAADVQMDEASKKATAKSLEYLAGKQNTDGSWSEARYPHNTAITSFALMAFMSQGHLPGQGAYGPEVAKGARFLISAARPEDGYLIGSRGGNMYCHAMATLALGELWGMTGDEEILPVLKKAVELIVKSQNAEGGWRDPLPTGADISVTIMQVMALRAAKNSGLHVPDATMKKAIAYINKCYNKNAGGFSYMPGQAPGFARTAAGACVLQLTGNYDAEQIPKAVDFMKKHFDNRERFWYGHYYASHAMHQVGGKEWEDWYNRIKDMLVSKQGTDGAFTQPASEGVGPIYQTSIGIIILSVPMNYLPIFQR